MQPHHRIELDRPHLGALAHDLLVHLAIGGHVDRQIAQDRRLAAEPATRGEAAALAIALLDRAGPETCSAREVMPSLANAPSPTVTWQRPQRPRPPQTESRSTPSARAACSNGVPMANRPRLPDGVKTTRAVSLT